MSLVSLFGLIAFVFGRRSKIYSIFSSVASQSLEKTLHDKIVLQGLKNYPRRVEESFAEWEERQQSAHMFISQMAWAHVCFLKSQGKLPWQKNERRRARHPTKKAA